MKMLKLGTLGVKAFESHRKLEKCDIDVKKPPANVCRPVCVLHTQTSHLHTRSAVYSFSVLYSCIISTLNVFHY